MKKLLLSFAVLLTVASIFAFSSTDPVPASKKEVKRTPCTYQFIYGSTTNTNRNLPAQYATTSAFTPCTGGRIVCGLCFNLSSLVYTAAENPSQAGKPKVDQTTLTNALNAAIGQPGTPVNPFIYTIPGTSDVIEVWLKP